MKKISILFLSVLVSLSGCLAHQLKGKKKWNPEEYSKNNQSHFVAAHHLIKQVNFTGKEQLLDVGSGDGRITVQLAEKLPEGSVVGVDISKPMVEYAKAKFPPSEFPNLRFKRGDAANLGFYKKFDMVVSFFTLLWVKDQKKALNSIFESLKPEGQFIATNPEGYPEAMKKALEDTLLQPQWVSYFHNFDLGQFFLSPEQYENYLHESGFSTLLVQRVEMFDRFQNMEQFLNFVQQWLPYLKVLSESQKSLFMADLGQNYKRYSPPDDEGGVWFKKYNIEILARKG